MIKILTAKTWAFGMGENLSQMVLKQWVGMLWGALREALQVAGIINTHLMMDQMQRQDCLLRDVHTLVFLSFQTL